MKIFRATLVTLCCDFYHCNKKKCNHRPLDCFENHCCKERFGLFILTGWCWICNINKVIKNIETILRHICWSDCWNLCAHVTWIGKQGLEFPHMCRQLSPSKKAALLVLWGVKEMSWSIYWPQSTSIWEYASSSKRHWLEICIILLLTSRTLKYDWCQV